MRKLIRWGPHEATFNGIHNASKSKVLITLYHHRHKLGNNGGLSLRELSIYSGVPYSYLESRLGKWAKWKYVLRKVKMGGNRPVFCYEIAARGEKFVEIRIPADRREDYVKEIRQWRSTQQFIETATTAAGASAAR